MPKSCPVKSASYSSVEELPWKHRGKDKRGEQCISLCDVLWWRKSLTKLRLWGFHCYVVISLIKSRDKFDLGTNRAGEWALLSNNCDFKLICIMWVPGQNIYLCLTFWLCTTYPVIKMFYVLTSYFVSVHNFGQVFLVK